MKTSEITIKVIINTFLWGFFLWLFGYILGFIFFAFVPKEQIGIYILPLGVTFTIWVLIKKTKREKLIDYLTLSIIWTLLAIALDFLFIVKLLNSLDYYKFDVFVYYLLTFVLPIAVGIYKKFKGIIT